MDEQGRTLKAKTMIKIVDKQRLLRAVAVALSAAGIATLLPGVGAKGTFILGYPTLCPFAPISTVLSLYVGVTVYRYCLHSA